MTSLERIALVGTETIQHRRRVAESVNGILDFSFDESRRQTEAEELAGITPTNQSYPPGDIRRYGADASDPDNSAAIQRALDVGGAVFVPKGTFAYSSTIYYRAESQTISGAEGSILSYTGSAIGISMDGKFSCVVKDIEIRAPSATAAVYVGYIAHFSKVLNCDIRGSSAGALASGSVSTGVGIFIERSYYVDISGNDVSWFSAGVQGADECNGNFIYANSLRGNHRGVYMTDTTRNSDGCQIILNEIEGGAAGAVCGIDIQGCSNMMVAVNRIEYSPNGDTHIFVHDGDNDAVRHSILDNHCVGTIPSIIVGDNTGSSRLSSNSIRGGWYSGSITIGVDADFTEIDIASGRFIGGGSGKIESKLINNSVTSITSVLEDQSTTLTLTGCATSPTGDVIWTINKNSVTLQLPTVSAVSTSVAATLGTLPQPIRPYATRSFLWRVTDNSAVVIGDISISTAGVITLSNTIAGGGAMTNGGTKGIIGGPLTYPLN
jgi:hypothetical protein